MPNSFPIMSKMKSKMEKLRGMRHIYNYIYNTQIITAEKAAGENPRRGPLLGFSPILTVWAKIAGGGGVCQSSTRRDPKNDAKHVYWGFSLSTID